MTITVQPARNEYTANAGQTIFNYTFKIFADTDLNVYITPAGEVADDDTQLTTAYTVTGIGDEDGGSITLTTGTNQEDLVTIVSNIPSSRTIDYQNNGDFRPVTVNSDFDRVVSIAKKIEDTANRTLLLPQSQQDPKPLDLPKPAAGFSVRWNAAETGMENYDPSTVSNEEIAADKVVINYGTLNAALNDSSLKLNQACNIKERTATNGGGSMWDVVLTSTVTPNDDDIFQSIALPTLSLVERRNTRIDQYQLSFNTINDLVMLTNINGVLVNIDFLASQKAVVTTNFNNLHILNDEPGGGASYQILTAVDYGGTPDGATIGGVVAGADHYIGGGTDYVAKYIPKDGIVEAEALGYYSGQNTGTGDLYEDATAVFTKVLDYAQDKPVKLEAKQNYYVAMSYGSLVAGVKRHIEIIGSGMPVLDRNPNAPWEYNRLIGGTRIRGYLSLLCTSASLREFGIDGAPEATDNWPYGFDALGVKTYDTALSNSCYLDKIIALGKSYDTPAHAIIISGFNNTFASDCQGYSTWYGISVDMKNATITNFIGGNHNRNCVNLKSHQDTGPQGDRFNQTCAVTNVTGVNPTLENGDNFGSSVVAIEADGTNLERVVVSGVAGANFSGLCYVAPFNGAVMTNVMLSNLTGVCSSDPADEYPDIRVYNDGGSARVQNLHISDVQLQNVSYQAMNIQDVYFFSCDNFFANTGIGGIGVAPTINANFVEIQSDVLSASLDGFTLVSSFQLSGGVIGQGAIAWDNAVGGNRKGGRMLCVNIGTGAPA